MTQRWLCICTPDGDTSIYIVAEADDDAEVVKMSFIEGKRLRKSGSLPLGRAASVPDRMGVDRRLPDGLRNPLDYGTLALLGHSVDGFRIPRVFHGEKTARTA